MLRRVMVVGLMMMFLGPSQVLAVGEAAAPSLVISPSARAWGLGQSYVAVADDATAMYWNPGGLGFLDGVHGSITHSQLIPMLADDVYFESLNVCTSVPAIGTVGLSLIYLTYGKWWETTGEGIPVQEHTSYEFAIGGYYGFKLGKRNALGVGLKVSRVYLAPATSQIGEGAGWSFAADFGYLGRPSDRFSYGLAVQNLGPDMSFVSKDESAPLPRTFRAGIAFKPFVGESYSTLVSLEATKALIGLDDIFAEGKFSEVSRDATLNGGMELMIADFVGPRLGYIYDHDGKIEGWTFGFRIGVPVGAVLGFVAGGLHFDYASVPKAEDLGRESKFSLNYSLWGTGAEIRLGSSECKRLTAEKTEFDTALGRARGELEAERTLIAELRARINNTDTVIDSVEAEVASLEEAIEEIAETGKIEEVTEAPGLPREWTVVEGESLSGIAGYEEIYGDTAQWPRIYDANADRVEDPERIYPGQVLVIPR